MTSDELDVNEPARRLGAIATMLDGDVDAAEHAAGRERVAIAADTTSRPSRWRRRVTPALAAAILLAATLVVVRALNPAPLDYNVSGPLVAKGEWLGVAPDQGALSLRFSEGTEVDLGPSSQGRVADLTAHGARVVLGTGRLRARVVHRAGTAWQVDAGPYAIDVTGTAFDVAWEGERLEVSLHDGSVVVRGPSFPTGVRVAAGQRLVARPGGGSAELTSLFVPEPTPAPTTTAAPDTAPPKTLEPQHVPTHERPTWTELLASGDFRSVLDAATARGIDTTLRGGTLPELAALSDAARYSGNHALARRGLLAQRSRFPASSESHAAAFVLGRLADDEGSRDEALRWYDTYLREAPRGAFAAEASGRKLVSLARAGSTDSSRAAARQYLERYPNGAHAAYARELLAR